MGWVALFLGDLVRAERHFTLAMALNPNASDVVMHNSLARAYLGHAEEGLRLAERAMALNPTFPEFFYYFKAIVHVLAGEYGAALECASSVADMAPELPGYLCAAAGLAGDQDQALRLERVFLDRVGSCWAAPDPMTEQRAVDWFMSVNRYLQPRDRDRILQGLSVAGLAPTAAPTI
jgi:tetratricopeptide (TPR) repeat protein